MRRLGALSRHVVAAQGHEPHFIGEDSALALMLSPKNGERSAHSRLNRVSVFVPRALILGSARGPNPALTELRVRAVKGAQLDYTQIRATEAELRNELLLADGSDPELHHSGLQHAGIALRFSASDDEALPPSPAAVGVNPQLQSWVEAVERLSIPEFPTAAANMAASDGATAEALVAAATLAASRSCELVADHHGGPLHVTAGAWAVLAAAEHLQPNSPNWARMAAVQGLANANFHIQVGNKLGGVCHMPMLDPIDTVSTFSEVSHGNPNALADALDLLAEAIAGQRPIAAEMCLITALTAGARPGHLLTTLLDYALPRNCQDDQ